MTIRGIAGITPDGGTQIAPALSEAYRRIEPVQATFKHVVLLTDGISEEGDSISLAKEAASKRVTISTVGLGQDVNRAYLEKVASFSKGKSYFLTDPSGLEQILLRDVMEHTGSTAIEKALRPTVIRRAEIHWSELGDYEQAQSDYRRLLECYPQSEWRELAEARLSSMRALTGESVRARRPGSVSRPAAQPVPPASAS